MKKLLFCGVRIGLIGKTSGFWPVSYYLTAFETARLVFDLQYHLKLEEK